MSHCAVTAAQPSEGYLRRLGMRGPRRQVQFVLRRQGETHTGQHHVGATAVQPPDVRCTTATGPKLSDFQPVTIDEVRKLLASIPCKTSPLDVLPVSLCAELFAPAITTLANLSPQTGKFPARFKSAQVLPLLKKAGHHRPSPVNYRPISNLSTVFKVLERLVLARLRPHLTNFTNFS